MPERLRTLRHCIFTGGGTPSVIAYGDATFPKGTASVAAAKFPSQPKGVPLGELANGVSLRGWLQRVEIAVTLLCCTHSICCANRSAT